MPRTTYRAGTVGGRDGRPDSLGGRLGGRGGRLGGRGGRAGRHRRFVALLATVALLAGCAPVDRPGDTGAGALDVNPGLVSPWPTEPGGSPDRTESLASPESTACPEAGVRIRYLGVSAAMGLRAMGLELVNCGTERYRVDGYPVLRLLDGEGKPITVRVIPGAKGITSGFDDPPRPLVLAPGEAAGAAVLWRNLVDDPTVVATNAERLEVAPAEGQPTQDIGMEGPIDLGNTNRVGVSAWKKRPPTTPTPTPAPPTPTPPPSPAPLP